MRIGIYNHQHYRGGCPGCSQTYVKGMIADAMECQNRVTGIYGKDVEFINYTDLGDYPPENLDRPGYRNMMRDVKEGRVDAVIVLKLDKISNQVDLVLDTYQVMKDHGVKLLTLNEGERASEILDKALDKRKKG